MTHSTEHVVPAERNGDGTRPDTPPMAIPLRRWDMAYVSPVPSGESAEPHWVVVRADGTQETYPLDAVRLIAD